MIVEERVQKMPAFAEHIGADAFLARAGQDLPRREVLARLGDNHRHLIRADIEAAEEPFPGKPDSEYYGQGSCCDLVLFHLPASLSVVDR